ncbi:hypothetical protein RCL1_005300 [Eukaryota sp. TZLM3-RCL]
MDVLIKELLVSLPPKLLALSLHDLFHLCQEATSTSSFLLYCSKVISQVYPGSTSLLIDRFNSNRVLGIVNSLDETVFFNKAISLFLEESSIKHLEGIIICQSLNDFITHLDVQIAETLSSQADTFCSSISSKISAPSFNSLSELLSHHSSPSVFFGFLNFITSSSLKSKKTGNQASKVIAALSSKLKALLASSTHTESLKYSAQLSTIISTFISNSTTNLNLYNYDVVVEENVWNLKLDCIEKHEQIPISFLSFQTPSLNSSTLAFCTPYPSKILSQLFSDVFILDSNFLFYLQISSSFSGRNYYSISPNFDQNFHWDLTRGILISLSNHSIVHLHLSKSILDSIDLFLFLRQLQTFQSILSNNTKEVCDFPVPGNSTIKLNVPNNLKSSIVLTFEEQIPIVFTIFNYLTFPELNTTELVEIGVNLISSYLAGLGISDGYSLSKKIVSTFQSFLDPSFPLLPFTLSFLSFIARYYDSLTSVCSLDTATSPFHTRRSSIASVASTDPTAFNIYVSLLYGIALLCPVLSNVISDIKSFPSVLENLFPPEVTLRVKSALDSSIKTWFKDVDLTSDNYYTQIFAVLEFSYHLDPSCSGRIFIHSSPIFNSSVIETVQRAAELANKTVSIVDQNLDFSSIKSDWFICYRDWADISLEAINLLPGSLIVIISSKSSTFISSHPSLYLNFPSVSESFTSTSKKLPNELNNLVAFFCKNYRFLSKSNEEPSNVVEFVGNILLKIFHTIWPLFSSSPVFSSSPCSFYSQMFLIFKTLIPPLPYSGTVSESHLIRAFSLSCATVISGFSSDFDKNDVSSILYTLFPNDIPCVSTFNDNDSQFDSDEEADFSMAESNDVDLSSDSDTMQPIGSTPPPISNRIEAKQEAPPLPCIFSFALDPISGQWVPLSLIFNSKNSYHVTKEMASSLYKCHLFAPVTDITILHSQCPKVGKSIIVEQLCNKTMNNTSDESINTSTTRDDYSQLTARLVAQTARKGNNFESFCDEDDALYHNCELVRLSCLKYFSTVESFVSGLKSKLSLIKQHHYGPSLLSDAPDFNIVLLISLSGGQCLSDTVVRAIVDLAAGRPVLGLQFPISKIYIEILTASLALIPPLLLLKSSLISVPEPCLESTISIFSRHLKVIVPVNSPRAMISYIAELLLNWRKRILTVQSSFPLVALKFDLHSGIVFLKLLNSVSRKYLRDLHSFVIVIKDLLSVLFCDQLKNLHSLYHEFNSELIHLYVKFNLSTASTADLNSSLLFNNFEFNEVWHNICSLPCEVGFLASTFPPLFEQIKLHAGKLAFLIKNDNSPIIFVRSTNSPILTSFVCITLASMLVSTNVYSNRNYFENYLESSSTMILYQDSDINDSFHVSNLQYRYIICVEDQSSACKHVLNSLEEYSSCLIFNFDVVI